MMTRVSSKSKLLKKGKSQSDMKAIVEDDKSNDEIVATTDYDPSYQPHVPEFDVPTFLVDINTCKGYPVQDIFAGPQDFVFKNMEITSYERFRSSLLYKEMIHKHEMDERKHSVLHLVKMN